ncbi:CDP-alcohol phosphatidyltransferase family protein [Sinomicrobium sp.]
MKRHIPNILTLLNLFCGTVAVLYAVLGQFQLAALFVFAGIFFDFFDGFAARKLKVQSEIGLQLDSLADMVTSGVVPGIVMYQLLQRSLIPESWDTGIQVDLSQLQGFIPFIGLLIPLSSAYRLAKFNVDDDQKTSFTGLPTPANALFVLSLPLIFITQSSEFIISLLHNTWFLVVISLLSSYILNAPIKLFALKFKTWGIKDNAIKYGFLLLCLILLAVLRFTAVPLIIILYLLISVVTPKRHL